MNVLVIGAGPGGLGAAAELRRRGADVLVVDGAGHVASTWRSAYDRVRLNTLGRLSHLPGAPMPRAAGRWPARDAYLAYLERYAADNEIPIRLRTRVERLDRDGDGWRARTSRAELHADAVVVATGYSNEPVVPRWPGQSLYGGRLLHSSAYRNGGAFAGHDALVVGAGNSAAEIAVDLAEAGARVSIAIRTPPHIVVRELGPVPNQVIGIALRRAPLWLADRVIDRGARAAIGDLSAHGLPRPEVGAATRARREGAIPIVDAGFAAAVHSGRIQVVGAVERLTVTGAIVAGGEAVGADVIVAATGYRPALEPLVGHLGVLDARGLPLVHGEKTMPGLPGLHFIGFTNPITGNLREMRLDARRIGRAVTARRALQPRPAVRPACCPAGAAA